MEVPRGMEPTGTNGRTRHTLSDPCGSGLVLWWFSRWMARNAVSCGHDDDTGKAFIARVRCPVPGPPRPESVVWLVPLPADPCGWPFSSGFAVVMAQVRRPVPFRTRKLRPGTAMVLHSRGCGRVARRRIQLSGPSGRVPCGIPGRSLFLFAQGVFLRPVGDYGRRQAGLREDSSSGWRFSDCGRPVGVLVIPVSGGIWTVRGLAAGGFLQ